MRTNNLAKLIEDNQSAYIDRIEAIPFPYEGEKMLGEHYLFCGALADSRGHIIGIPNKYRHILDINPFDGTIDQWGEVDVPNEKGWTGGGLASNGIIYGFPRGANKILKLDSVSRKIEYADLFKTYAKEHHYGGVIIDNESIYQPPRNSNKILVFNIVTEQSKEIVINTGMAFNKKMLFYGGLVDMEGAAYFFPTGKLCRVCMVDVKRQAKSIGKWLRHACFNSGTLAANGDVYGFSSCGRGILHINVKNKRVEVLIKNLPGGYYGAKLGFNGKIYSVPGNADRVLEFDSSTNKITNEIPLPDCEMGIKAKCAGGAIDREGNIWCVPAKGHYIYKICFAGIKTMPDDELYKSQYFRSFY